MTTLLGYGSHGRDIEAIYRRVHGKAVRRADDNPAKGMPVDTAALADRVVVGVNDPRWRRTMVLARELRGAAPLVDPSVMLGYDVQLSEGCVIAPRAVLLCEVYLGPHVHVNYGVTMTRTTIGAFSTVCPGVTICGDVEIGEEVLVGAGATICDRVTLGNEVTVAAGAVVPPCSVVPDGAKVIGVWKQ